MDMIRAKVTKPGACRSWSIVVLFVGLIASAACPARAGKPTNASTFSVTGTMNVARAGHTVTLLNTGEVLVAGGVDVNGTPLTSTELYNPAKRRWTLTGSMISGHAGGTATLLQN